MTPAEVADWLGFRPGELEGHGLEVRPHIVEGMKDVPVPRGDADQVPAFAVFLECHAGKGRAVAQPSASAEVK